MLIKNILISLKKNKFISFIILILLIVCIVSSLFALNDVYNKTHKYNEYLIDEKTIILTVNSEIIPDFTKLINDYSDSLLAINCNVNLSIKDNIDKSTNESFTAYLYLSDTLNNEYPSTYGKNLTQTMISNKSKFVLLNLDNYDIDIIDKEVNINDIIYKCIGLADKNIIPLSNFIETRIIDNREIKIIFNDIPSEKTLQEFSKYLTNNYPNCIMTIPDNDKVKSFIDFAPTLLPTLVLILICFIDLSYIYKSFIDQRKTQYIIYNHCGAKLCTIYLLSIGEMIIIMTFCFFIGLFTYSTININSNAKSIYDTKNYLSVVEYLYVYFFLLVFFVLVFTPKILKSLKRNYKG